MKRLAVEKSIDIRRRFVRVQGRGVHYLRAGTGSPVVLLHSGNASARTLIPLVERLARDHAVFAFDHPGHGDSDVLPKRHVRVADVADALKATLVALKIPPCPIYGSHSGADVALELGRRHPEHASGLILDGVTIFGPQETKYFLGEEYMPSVGIRGDGSHLLAIWVKTRDVFTWFPWSRPLGDNRRPYIFPAPGGLHNSFLDRLRAGDEYRSVYGAAFEFDVCTAVRTLNVPATFMAAADDPLFLHLDRLPKLKSNQRIERYPADSLFSSVYADKVANVVRSYRVPASEEGAADSFSPTAGSINRRYIDLTRGQILVRSAGEGATGKSLLLLHEGRASSRVLEPLMKELANRRAVYAPDLPDNGASDPLHIRNPLIRDYADAVADMVTALGLASCDIYAVGAGAAVALDLLGRPKFVGARAVLEAPDFYAPQFARSLAQAWVPQLGPEWDGAHLNKLWLMLRDEYAFWPWFDKSPSAACAMDAPNDWQEMHARVTDILRSLATYHRLTIAALRYDWKKTLRRVRQRVIIPAMTANDSRQPHVEAAVRFARLSSVAPLDANLKTKARQILRLCSAR